MASFGDENALEQLAPYLVPVIGEANVHGVVQKLVFLSGHQAAEGVGIAQGEGGENENLEQRGCPRCAVGAALHGKELRTLDDGCHLGDAARARDVFLGILLHFYTAVCRGPGKGTGQENIQKGQDNSFSPVSAESLQGFVFEKMVRFHTQILVIY